ncbi:MAG: hypothetical protein VX346_01290 [Planctomycetota bacterium]|nr:hypothetical protein [Planctomycetota bacterium]
MTQPPANEQPEKPATDTETAEQAGTAGEEAATEEAGNPTPTTNEAAETVAEQAVEATAPALPRTLAEIGSKFMQSVFSMNPGELSIAWNEPKTVCYLVQITAQQQPNTELHKQFVEKRLNLQQTDAQQIAQIHRQEALQTVQGLFEEFERRLKVDWPGRPDRGTTPYGQR